MEEDDIEILVGALRDTNIPGKRVAEFQMLHLKVFSARPLPLEPEQTLQELVANSHEIMPTIWHNGRWLFQIKKQKLIKIMCVPIITKHAKKRLKERFGMEEPFLSIKVALEIGFGHLLTWNDRKFLKVAGDYSGYVFNKRVYLMPLNGFQVITAFKYKPKT